MQRDHTTGVQHSVNQVFLFAGSNGEVGVETLLHRGSGRRVVGLGTAIDTRQAGSGDGALVLGEGIHPRRQVGVGVGVVTLESVSLGTIQDEGVGGEGRDNHSGIALAVDNVGIFHILTHLVVGDTRRTANLGGLHIDVVLGAPETGTVDGLGIGNLGVVAIALADGSRTIDPRPVGTGGNDEQVGLVAGVDKRIVLRTACRQFAQSLPVAHHIGGYGGEGSRGIVDTLVEVRLVVLHIIKVEAGGKGLRCLLVEVVLGNAVEVVVDERQTSLNVGGNIGVELSHRATAIDGRHGALGTLHISDTHCLVAGLAAVGQAEDVAQHEVAIGTAEQCFATLWIQTGGVATLGNGVEHIVGGGNALVAALPDLVRAVLVLVGNVLPRGSLLMERGTAVVEGGIALAAYAVVGIVAVQFGHHEVASLRVGAGQQLGDIAVRVQRRAVIGQHVQIVVAR